MRILRVFPRETKCTPIDAMSVVGEPGLFRPEADEVHVSVTFTWDIERGKELMESWGRFYGKVLIGGPAIDGEGEAFEPGVYLIPGLTITSRGCPNRCPWCLVGGNFRELEIRPGWDIQDNNILAASRKHFLGVMSMLRSQRRFSRFSGGLEAGRLKDWHIEQLRGLKGISELFFACDHDGGIRGLHRVAGKLSWLKRAKLRCYVLCAYGGQTIGQAIDRLESVWDAGFMPFAQLYQPPKGAKIEYSQEWRHFARNWSRQPIMKAMHP